MSVGEVNPVYDEFSFFITDSLIRKNDFIVFPGMIVKGS